MFNPEQKHKRLIVEGFGSCDIKQQLTWQTLTLDMEGDLPIRLDSLKIYVEDTDRNGEIYIDSINFV